MGEGETQGKERLALAHKGCTTHDTRHTTHDTQHTTQDTQGSEHMTHDEATTMTNDTRHTARDTNEARGAIWTHCEAMHGVYI